MPTYGNARGGTASIRTDAFFAAPRHGPDVSRIITPGPVTWGTPATDTFTAADATSIDARLSDSGHVWTLSGGSITITSNAATNASGHGFFPIGDLALGHSYPNAFRVSVAYTNVTVSQVGVGFNYTSTTYGGDYDCIIRVATNGTVEFSAAGLDDIALTGTLTGQPTSGTLTVEIIGTTIRVLINGAQIATGTLPGTLLGSRAVLQLANAGPTADNFNVEVPASEIVTSVTSSRSTTWNTLAAVTSSRATTWNTRAAVASSRATTWNVRAAVTSTRATTWNVLTSTTSTRATTWRVLAQVSSTRATTWNVAAAVTSSRATTWNVRAVVSSTRATTWNVRAVVSSTRATTWNVRVAVTSTRATTWNVAASPVGPFTITGDLGTLVGADFPTPAPSNVVVRLELAGGIRDTTLPTTVVAADGTFTLTGIPSSLSGARYRLAALWRTGIVGVPVQEIALDPLTVLADADLLDLV